MTSCDFTYHILKLTSCFYNTYPNPPYVEILSKPNRAYNCLLINAYEKICICIPYRTHIAHNYAYHFKNSVRSKSNQSGLDYTKMVIVNNSDFLDDCNAIIDQDEFHETVANIERIKREALTFLEDYVSHKKGVLLLNKSEFRRRYRFSPLQYFHKELGIEE